MKYIVATKELATQREAKDYQAVEMPLGIIALFSSSCWTRIPVSC
jgi:hypothetical protein